MALKVEGIVDGGVHAEEALGGSGGFEALHFALAPSNNLMRIFRPRREFIATRHLFGTAYRRPNMARRKGV